MYNTDRLVGYDFHGGIEFVEIPGSFEPKGKEFARGYGGPRPHTLRNMGTDKGRKPFDFRRLFWNLAYVWEGTRTWQEFQDPNAKLDREREEREKQFYREWKQRG